MAELEAADRQTANLCGVLGKLTSGGTVNRAVTPRRSMDGLRSITPGGGLAHALRSASIHSVTKPSSRPSISNKLLGNRAISKFLARSQSRGSLAQVKSRASLWKKLRQEENPKKLKMLRLKRKIRIALKTSLFLRHWWHRHLKSVDTMVISDDKMDFLAKLMSPPAKEEMPADIMFDVAAFKANKYHKIPQEARRILTILPQYRSEQEVHYVMIALRAHKQIANYPVRMQKLIAQYGFLECFDEKRCVIKQGHPPQAFYYIFYGSVNVAVDEGGEKKVLCVLERGESFGELAIVNDEDRQSSVISKTEIELISIKRETYEDAFMAGGSKKITDPDHEQFIKSLEFLDGWPTRLLDINPKLFVFTYFQRGAVIVKDSSFNDWLIVIKSGSVDVLKKLLKSKPTVNKRTGAPVHSGPKPERERFEAFICGDYQKFCHENKISVPAPLSIDERLDKRTKSKSPRHLPQIYTRRRSLSAPMKRGDKQALDSVVRANTNSPDQASANKRWRKSIYDVKMGLKEKFTLAKLVQKHVRLCEDAQEFEPATEKPQPASEKRTYVDDFDKGYRKRAHLITPADRNPQFVKVQTLTKGSNFGLADIILGRQPSFCLISNGAECVMINKEFYRENCPQALLRKLLPMVSPYPEDETMQGDLITKLNWDAQREVILENTVGQIKQTLIRAAR